jgi:8-oxo-dGTP pyrophosphatase MutT (NUDIX family)
MSATPANMKDVLVLFVDVRGFTKWSNSTEVFPSIAEFVGGFLAILKKHFPAQSSRRHPRHVHKPLGDGAMIVREIEPIQSGDEAGELLAGVLEAIAKCQDEFATLCETFGERVGQKTAFGLGWGIVRGKAMEYGGDYLGHNINKAARLCDAARPSGVVIDVADFPRRPDSSIKFYRQERKLSGMDEVEAWVTEEVYNQFLTRELVRQRPEVHVAGLCFDPHSKPTKVLIAKRSPRRRLYPNHWEGCGGQLAESESFAEGVKRHYRMEMRMDVTVLEHLHLFYEIREPSLPLIPGIRFACERVGEQTPESVNHTELRWATRTEIGKMDEGEFVPGLKKHILDMMAAYDKAKK